MRQIRRRFCLGALALTAGTSAALADVTADQIWDDWRAFSSKMGQTVTTGAETRSGDRLTVTDATFTTTRPDLTVTSKFGEIALRNRNDGRVEITLSPDFTVSVNSAQSTDAPMSMDLLVRQTNLKVIASGDPTQPHYDYAADALVVTLQRFQAGGADTKVTGTGTFHNLNGAYTAGGANDERQQSTMKAKTLDIDFSAKSAAKSTSFSLKGRVEDIGASSDSVRLTELVEQAETVTGLPDGFAMNVDYHVGFGSYTIAIDNPDATATTTIQSADNALRLRFDTNALSYAASTGATSMVFSSPAIPLPEVAAAFSAAEASFAFPIGKSTEPQDFSIVTRLIDFTVGDNIWGLIDPGAVLPRDPATLIIDIAGKANWLVPPAELAQTTEGLPAELHALTLENLKLAALGAALTGTGAFTFDNADLATFAGYPKPTGEVNLTLTGANTLIDKLVNLGFVPQDQAMGARMMLGLFARPVEGQDKMTSRIEAREDGSVFANGQRLK